MEFFEQFNKKSKGEQFFIIILLFTAIIGLFCITGCIKAEDKETNMNGFFYGSSDSDEKIIGCADGCGGCVASGGTGAYSIHFLESYTGID